MFTCIHNFLDSFENLFLKGRIFDMKEIYFDNSATTCLRDEVFSKMITYFKFQYGNPSSIYKLGIECKKAINESRKQISELLHCKPSEIYFTSGASESNNWVLKSFLINNNQNKKHIIISNIEHSSILETAKFLETQGYEVTYLKVNKLGIINVNDLEKKLRKDTLLVSIMYVNNEIGTIQPIEEIAELCRTNSIYFHTDAVQAMLHINVDINKLKVDLLSFTGHKIYGPKGIGVLYIKEGTPLKPFIHGGQQEHSKRAGTENTPYIVAIGEALNLCYNELMENQVRNKLLTTKVIEQLNNKKFDFIVNGDTNNKVDGILNISLKNVDGNRIAFLLAEKGIYISNGSACNSGNIAPSHVLKAIDIPQEYIRGTLRISFGRYNRENDVNSFIDELSKIMINMG